MERLAHALLVLFTSSLALGCSVTSKAMVPADHGAIVGASDAATVVFVRPSSYKAEDITTIVDGRGRFLGDSPAASYFAVRVPAGENVFISCAANTAAMRATLTSGKIYFVEVSTKPGFFRTNFELVAIRPQAASWARLDEWITDSEAYVPDESLGQRVLAARGTAASCVRRGLRNLADYSTKNLGPRTLSPGDDR